MALAGVTMATAVAGVPVVGGMIAVDGVTVTGTWTVGISCTWASAELVGVRPIEPREE